MPVDRQCQAVLDSMASLRSKPLEQMTPGEARRARAETEETLIAMAGEATPMARVSDRVLDGVPVRIYWPTLDAGLPVVLYYHGGGWVLGTLDQIDRPCRDVAARSGAIVVSVDYRLAPEHKFPAPLEDAYTAVQWVAAHGGELGADASRIAVAGDSAGGNLAAAVTLLARERGGPNIRYQALIYPVTHYRDDSLSLVEFAENHLLTRAGMAWFWGHYLKQPEDGDNPLASPLEANLEGLPPALVITAGCDPLRDQGEAYAARLSEAGVPVELTRYEGAIHAFFQMGGVIDAGRRAVGQVALALKGALREK